MRAALHQPRSRQRRGLPRYAVVMAGGHGTRFWPRSRRRVPKQLLRIIGRHSLLQETVRRLRPMFSWRHIVVVTNGAHAAAVRRQLPRVPAENILVEPVGRDTAPCTALAAEWIATRAPDALMAVVPADHVIKDAMLLRRTLRSACDLAEDTGALVTLGIVPTRPEIGYGYVEAGAAIGGRWPEASWVKRFHEKPAAPAARRYVNSGRYLWNSGMFVWKTSAIRSALELCLPKVYRPLAGVWAVPAQSRRAVAARLRRVYRTLPSVSVDVGIMQALTALRKPALRVAVVHAHFDWNDVGSWASMPELWGCDENGNAAIGRILALDARASIVYCPDRLVALVGVSNLVVVDSADALLICARDRVQDVRQVTEELRRRGWLRHL